ncbi:predicted protein [Chaetomium globosum CBS 148.51]|uniref:Uncharacterized protein n=1 Tax=Chaetomium globosum (strain ATCC 6205 / CBS 148.51 / DSM 1962 / NBRC 6347 / NRRL 1970) TaxID=306901 RepID=Q2H5U2_CHAGB|nr:uncharacterized protein CHGG_05973 [Chaetomium globosum CBS 148.51]EAQ89354.1 predicted protein [Chaetomium globosum CBS 148.51]
MAKYLAHRRRKEELLGQSVDSVAAAGFSVEDIVPPSRACPGRIHEIRDNMGWHGINTNHRGQMNPCIGITQRVAMAERMWKRQTTGYCTICQTNGPQTRNLAAEKFHRQIPASSMPYSYGPHTALWARHEHAKNQSIGSHDPSTR